MGKKAIVIKLSDEETATLRMWANAGKTEQRMALTSKVILLASQGHPLSFISRELGLNINGCLKWRRRFIQMRLEGLKDSPRSGKPPRITADQRVNVIRLASENRSDGSNAWQVQRLAKRVGLGATTVHRILNQGVIKPHKVDHWCGKSPDPEFEEKQTAIIGLYMDPPENALVLTVDEKPQIQSLDRSQPELPLRPGNPKRHTATYKRHGTTCLLAALAVHIGKVVARRVEKDTHEEFLAFLKNLYRKNPSKHIHTIADNFSSHKDKKIIDWVSCRRRLTLHFTPTFASCLNQVEIWFSVSTRDVIKGGIWHSKEELVKQIMHYI